MARPPQESPSRTDKPAEREAAQQDVFLREVDDALREDQLIGFFRNHGRKLALVVGAGLLGFAGWLWWNHAQEKAAGERGEQLVVALDSIEAGNLSAGDKQLAAIAQDSAGGSAVAARLMRANIALSQNRVAEAVKLYGEVAADKSAPQPYRDLATVRGIAANFDAMDPQQVIDRLKPLAVPGNPWFGPSAELTGIAYLRQGRNNLAGPLFAKIAGDGESPEPLRRRARQMAGLLGVDAVDDSGKLPGEDEPAGDQ